MSGEDSKSRGHTKSLLKDFQKASLDEVIKLREDNRALHVELSQVKTQIANFRLEMDRRISQAVKEVEKDLEEQLKEKELERKEYDKEHDTMLKEQDGRLSKLEKAVSAGKTKIGSMGAIAGAGSGGILYTILQLILGG